MNTPQPFEVSALIPWYLNGTLSEAEKAQVESYLRNSPGAESQLLLWRAVQVHATTSAVIDAGTELGWRRLQGTLRRERREPVRWWMMAAAASVLLIAGLQTAVLLRDRPADHYAPLSGTSAIPADAVRVQVRFVDSATINEVNALLQRFDARVIDGPSALGIYELALPRGTSDLEDLRARLEAEPLLRQVAVAP